jgi:lipopolysaccharide export system protein LptC
VGRKMTKTIEDWHPTKINKMPEPSNINDRRQSALNDSYSSYVFWMKHALVFLAIIIIAAICLWPFLGSKTDQAIPTDRDFSFEERVVINAKYTGLDERGNPFKVIAARGVVKNKPDSNEEIVYLTAPYAEFYSENKQKYNVLSKKGEYFPATKLLKMYEDVHLRTEDGVDFKTNSAIIECTKSLAQGNDAVCGTGPQGDIKAEGFRAVDKGNRIVFIGNADITVQSQNNDTH